MKYIILVLLSAFFFNIFLAPAPRFRRQAHTLKIKTQVAVWQHHRLEQRKKL